MPQKDIFTTGQDTKSFLKEYIKNHKINIYICGPPPMMETNEKFLSNLSVEKKDINHGYKESLDQ